MRSRLSSCFASFSGTPSLSGGISLLNSLAFSKRSSNSQLASRSISV
jgi:hypothetical protein